MSPLRFAGAAMPRARRRSPGTSGNACGHEAMTRTRLWPRAGAEGGVMRGLGGLPAARWTASTAILGASGPCHGFHTTGGEGAGHC